MQNVICIGCKAGCDWLNVLNFVTGACTHFPHPCHISLHVTTIRINPACVQACLIKETLAVVGAKFKFHITKPEH